MLRDLYQKIELEKLNKVISLDFLIEQYVDIPEWVCVATPKNPGTNSSPPLSHGKLNMLLKRDTVGSHALRTA